MRNWSAKRTVRCTRPSGWGGTRSRPRCLPKLPSNFRETSSREISIWTTRLQLFPHWHQGCSLQEVDAGGASTGCRMGGTGDAIRRVRGHADAVQRPTSAVAVDPTRMGRQHRGVHDRASTSDCKRCAALRHSLVTNIAKALSITLPGRSRCALRPLYFRAPARKQGKLRPKEFASIWYGNCSKCTRQEWL